MDELVSFLRYAGKISEGEVEHLYRQNLNIVRRHGKKDHLKDIVSAFRGLAREMEKNFKIDDAEKLYRECLEIERKLCDDGVQGICINRSLCDLADLVQAKGSSDEAESLYRENLEILRESNVKGGDRVGVENAMFGSAGAMKDNKKIQDAEKLYRDCLEIQ